jgi:purine nucleoside phosphorylase
MKSFVTGIIWGFALIGVSASITYLYAANQDMKTPHHTSTVMGHSGDLKCTTSCVVKENRQ